ncbi:MAG TPA: DUF2599 domain-containing protein [Mycobacterium sp.]|nr:DUF2599 domain-containing protein [Mycobacterium sp.]
MPVALAAVLAVLPAAAARAGAEPPPALIDHVEWVSWDGQPSLRVYPTAAARVAAARFGTLPQAEQAWAEVLAQTPDAASPGMREQFNCHWEFAELAQPGKTSWNLEPWRPVVDGVTMLESGCNPGAAEEAF